MSFAAFLQDAAIAMLAGSGAGIAAMFTWLRSKRADQRATVIATGKLELENRREDGAAYERASKINGQIVEGLRTELSALQETIRELRADLALERQHSAHLEEHIRSLEASAATMRGLLSRAGVEYSPNNLEGTE